MAALVTPSRATTIRVSLPTVELEASSSDLVFPNERSLKEWILKQYKETLLATLSVDYYDTDTNHVALEPEAKKSEDAFTNASSESASRVPEKQLELDESQNGSGVIATNCKPLLSSGAHVDHPGASLSRGALGDEGGNRRLDLLDYIASVQRQFFQSEHPKVVFGSLLKALLELTESEYGFIGEIKYDDDGTMYLQTHAVTNIAWNQATRQFYEDNRDAGLKFYNLKTLFGTVMTTGKPLIANDPATHPKRAGIPEGHPPLRHFLGIPFFKMGGEINGMVGISNKPGGYSLDDIDFLEPLTVTCSNLIQAYIQKNQNQWLINNLENSVRARTHELELANANLEEANRTVKQTAQMQLQHFACMSHEIRTPLNCIIGMSSLLKETKMTRMQEETMQMIIESGNLLVAIVNDVLDYAKLETGSFELEIRKSSLEDTLSSIVHSIETKAQARGQSVRLHYSTSLPRFVHMDSRRVQQILFNLLGNAIKFSKDNSVIDFAVDYLPSTSKTELTVSVDHSKNLLNQSEAPVPLPRAVPPGYDSRSTLRSSGDTSGSCATPVSASSYSIEPVTSSADSDISRCPFHKSATKTNVAVKSTGAYEGKVVECCPSTNLKKMACDPATCLDPKYCSGPKMLRFVVKDYGKGIPKQDFEKIFKPFQQVINSEAEDVHGGTGLGLAITHRLVSAMGGVISVDSVLGAWSEFTVDIPCCDPPTDAAAFRREMQNCTVAVVGAKGSEKECAQQVFQFFEIDFVMFDSMEDLQSEFLQRNFARSDRTYVCLFQEDAYKHNQEPYNVLSRLTRSTLITFGDQFRIDSRNHIRDLQKTIPSVLMERLLETFRRVDVEQKEESTSGVLYDRIRVLAAEDNKVNQKVLHRMLVRLGIKHIDIVENGKLAVEKESESKYDIVLMDQQMPVMGGLSACRHIISRTGGHTKPFIVFVTAHVSPEFASHAYEAGATDFISKPFKLEQISGLFERLFAGP